MNELLFFKVFKNKVLCKLIFLKVHHIHRDILLLKEDKNVFKWSKLINNLNILSYYNYLNEIKQYHHNNISKDLFKNRDLFIHNNKLIEFITRGDSLDVLQYFINQIPELLTIKSTFYNYDQNRSFSNDLLFYSVKYNSMKIFKYLESFANSNNKGDSSSLSPTLNVEWDYYNALKGVPEKGDMELFLYISQKIDIKSVVLEKRNNNGEYFNITKAIESSTLNGRVDMLDHIFGIIDSNEIINDILINQVTSIFPGIIKKGHLCIFTKYYINIKLDSLLSNIDLISDCAKYNQFEMMKYFHDNKLGAVAINAMDNAILSGNFEMFQWLHYNRTEGCSTDAIDYAAKNGNLEIIKWLHHNRTEGCTVNAMSWAADNGHIEVIKWLHENRTEGCTIRAMDYAAKKNHFDIVKWLHYNRTEGCTTHAIEFAAMNGHLEIVKWLHENRTEGCTTYAVDNTVQSGHLETIKWLLFNRSEGCTTKALDNAAHFGHLETIKWLHHNRSEGCTTNAMDMAAYAGHLEIVKWLHHNRTEGCTTHAMNSAATNGDFEILKWLHENRTEGCTTEAMDLAAHNGRLEIVKWLHENRTEGCTIRAMEYASRNGHFEILDLLLDNSSESITQDVFTGVAMEGHLESLKKLVSISPDTCKLGLEVIILIAERNGNTHIVEYLRDTFK